MQYPDPCTDQRALHTAYYFELGPWQGNKSACALHTRKPLSLFLHAVHAHVARPKYTACPDTNKQDMSQHLDMRKAMSFPSQLKA